ncbi:MAG: dTDP-4-dehydrorhamnose 3,5-epimerase family protein [Bdellovibrionales bacterium]|nr:dTDP-4-dehydrorhamnose 3,5-epimerase family protein [Bdellovibrionales bacterium]
MVIQNIEETFAPETAIDGVTFKPVRSHPDDRGFFRELIRCSDPFFADGFAQWSHSKMARQTVKAWHFHHRQTDWWYVGVGVARTVLIDNRKESPTYRRQLEFFLGEPSDDPKALCAVVRIPPGVLHGCRVESESAHLFYITSTTYNPEDEGRLPFNDPEIGYNWGPEEQLIVSDNDRKTFIPPHPLEDRRR